MTDHAAWLRMHARRAETRAAPLNSSPSIQAQEFIDGMRAAADGIDQLKACLRDAEDRVEQLQEDNARLQRQVLQLRRDVAVQWRDWAEVDAIDADLAKDSAL